MLFNTMSRAYALYSGASSKEVSTNAERVSSNICVVCQDEIDEAKGNTVTLRCGHVFHGQCLCDHLVCDNRCPVCRDAPESYGYTASVDIEDDYEEENNQRIPRYVALANAQCDVNNLSTGRMVKTMNKWKREKLTAIRKSNRLRRQIKSCKVALNKKVKLFEKKLMDKFKSDHAHLFEERKTVRRTISRARCNLEASRDRIAKRYGWVQ